MIKFKHHQQTNRHDYLNLDPMHICIPKACIVGCCPRFSGEVQRRTKTPTTVTFYCSFFSGWPGPNSYTRILQEREKVLKNRGGHTGAKIHILSKNSQFGNHNFHKIHLSEISFFTKFTFLKSNFSQNSQF